MEKRILGGAVLSMIAACGPAAPAKDPDAIPSLEAVCEHRAELQWRGSAQTKEEVQRDCEKSYASYRDEGERAAWSCRSRCYMAAQKKEDLAQCSDRCPIPKPNVNCADVFLEAEIAGALKAPLKAGRTLGPLEASGSCGGTFKTEEIEVQALLSVHPTAVLAQEAAKATQNSPATSRSQQCIEIVDHGRFTLSLSLEPASKANKPPCDRDALKQALSAARQHLKP